MKKAQPLNPIKEKLSQSDGVKLWLDDEAKYQELQVHHDALVDHIQKFCQ